jgi:HemY protein
LSLYRTLLLWLALAALGALGWSWFSQDLGDVVIRFRGLTYTTTLFYLVVAWALLWFLIWMLTWLVRLPLRAWRRHARQQARNRLVSGFEALHQGRWQRAESLLAKAAEDAELRTPALIGARRAADARADVEAVARHHAALLAHDPAAAALEQATRLVELERHDDALAALASIGTTLPPRALLLQARAFAGSGRAHDAIAQLNTLRREQTLPADELAALEINLVAALMTQAPQADVLLQRWTAQPARLHQTPAVATAFAWRAAELGLEDDAARAVAAALDVQWDESLAALYGELPAGRAGDRLARAEAWLATRQASPALLLTLARLCRAQSLWGKAEDLLHRALAQGAGAEAWEELGHLYSAQDDTARAQVAYSNALRALRGETTLVASGRSLREQIADHAVAEERNEHGLPLIPR